MIGFRDSFAQMRYGLAQGGELGAIGQHDRFVKTLGPGHDATPQQPGFKLMLAISFPAALRGEQPKRPYIGGVPAFRSCEMAVTICAGANGLVKRMLFGTPREAHSSAAAPVM